MGGQGGVLADLVFAGVPVALFVVITVILSAAGSALLASNRTKLHHMERLGDRRIKRLVELTAERARAVSAIRLARQVSTVALTIFATRAVLAFETDPVRLAIWAVGGVFLAAEYRQLQLADQQVSHFVQQGELGIGGDKARFVGRGFGRRSPGRRDQQQEQRQAAPHGCSRSAAQKGAGLSGQSRSRRSSSRASRLATSQSRSQR